MMPVENWKRPELVREIGPPTSSSETYGGRSKPNDDKEANILPKKTNKGSTDNLCDWDEV
jgi:hypothetical protein